VSAGYGETVVLENIDLEILEGEAVSVIGRNGVGKSTLLMTIMGHTDLHSGSVHLNGKEITAAKPCQRVWNGLGLVPQERLIFPSLTVDENLAVAVRAGSWTSTRVYSMFPQLDARRQNLGNQLSGGEQQMLAIGRALVGNPKVLLMDEPSEGLAPVIVEELQSVINRLREESSMTIILVEQNSRVALEFSERCIVMNRGRVVRDGSSEALRQDQTLLERLIGVDSSLL
jgi:branched-chain amino acid transport system ATP-binding protein